MGIACVAAEPGTVQPSLHLPSTQPNTGPSLPWRNSGTSLVSVTSLPPATQGVLEHYLRGRTLHRCVSMVCMLSNSQGRPSLLLGTATRGPGCTEFFLLPNTVPSLQWVTL